MVVKIEFAGTVRRIYSETRGTYTSKYIVVSDDGGKYENILRFKLKPDYTPSFAERAKVKISAYLDGREWANQQGQLMYFTDLKVDTIEVVGSEAPSNPANSAAKPTTATDWASLCALGAAFGEDLSALKTRCEAHKAKVNRKFTVEDWQSVAAEIVVAHTNPSPAPAANDFDDDMPF